MCVCVFPEYLKTIILALFSVETNKYWVLLSEDENVL